MDQEQRAPRKWYQTSKLAIVLVAIPVIALMAMDGLHVLELVSIVVALGAALYEAGRVDSLEERVSRMRRLIDHHGDEDG